MNMTNIEDELSVVHSKSPDFRFYSLVSTAERIAFCFSIAPQALGFIFLLMCPNSHRTIWEALMGTIFNFMVFPYMMFRINTLHHTLQYLKLVDQPWSEVKCIY
jgi:hypothetical protein